MNTQDADAGTCCAPVFQLLAITNESICCARKKRNEWAAPRQCGIKGDCTPIPQSHVACGLQESPNWTAVARVQEAQTSPLMAMEAAILSKLQIPHFWKPQREPLRGVCSSLSMALDLFQARSNQVKDVAKL